MSAQDPRDAEDPVFNAICFLALQQQFDDVAVATVHNPELDSLNQRLLTNFHKAASETPQHRPAYDLLARARELLGMKMAAGLFRKQKGVDVPKDLEDEIEQAIEDEATSDNPDDGTPNDR